MMENIDRKYAEKWINNEKDFIKNNDYEWMCKHISSYSLVLEIGSGAGESTLALLKNNHKVVVIENNKTCFEKALEKISAEKFKVSTDLSQLNESDVVLLCQDVMDDNMLEIIQHITPDIVLCWNVGTAWNDEKLEKYRSYLLKYRFPPITNEENVYKFYGELIQIKTIELAKKIDVPVHFIDRTQYPLNDDTDTYYKELKKEFKFSEIIYDSKETYHCTINRIALTSDGIENDGLISMSLMSILLK